jgi:hypothetical protein
MAGGAGAVALLTDIRRADVLLDADLRRLEAIALADLLANARECMRHRALRAHLLLGREIMHDRNSREMLWDRLAMRVGGTLAFVRADRRRALAVRLLGCLDRGKHLGLVEQHLLVGVLFGGIGGLRGTPVVLGLQPPHFLLEEHLALDRLRQLALGLVQRLLDLSQGLRGLLESLVLFAQQSILFFADVQANRKFGDFVRQGCGSFVRREHQ